MNFRDGQPRHWVLFATIFFELDGFICFRKGLRAGISSYPQKDNSITQGLCGKKLARYTGAKIRSAMPLKRTDQTAGNAPH